MASVDKPPSTIPPSLSDNKKFLILISLVIFALVIDTSVVKIIDLITIQFSSVSKVFLFVMISSFLMVGQIFILKYLWFRTSHIESSFLRQHTHYRMVRITQYGVIALFVLLILQIIFGSYYTTLLLIVSTILSYSIATLVMASLTLGFFSWFRIRRNYVILLYGISSLAIAINIIFSMAYLQQMLLGAPNQIAQDFFTKHTFFPQGPADQIFRTVHNFSSVIAFVITWTATVTLLNYYSNKIGKIKYWLMVSAPLVCFLSQFVIPLNFLNSFLKLDPVFFGVVLTLFFNVTRIIGGILFGAAFWIISRNLSHDNVLRDYLLIAGFGFLLLFVSNISVSVGISYPPFGMASLLFIGLSALLILVGVYSSAISIGEDTKLRQSIRKIAFREKKLLEGLGLAYLDQEIQRRVTTVVKNKQEEGEIKADLNESTINAYVADVIEEINRIKNETKERKTS